MQREREGNTESRAHRLDRAVSWVARQSHWWSQLKLAGPTKLEYGSSEFKFKLEYHTLTHTHIQWAEVMNRVSLTHTQTQIDVWHRIEWGTKERERVVSIDRFDWVQGVCATHRLVRAVNTLLDWSTLIMHVRCGDMWGLQWWWHNNHRQWLICPVPGSAVVRCWQLTGDTDRVCDSRHG